MTKRARIRQRGRKAMFKKFPLMKKKRGRMTISKEEAIAGHAEYKRLKSIG
jgi:hypothetical protein